MQNWLPEEGQIALIRFGVLPKEGSTSVIDDEGTRWTEDLQQILPWTQAGREAEESSRSLTVADDDGGSGAIWLVPPWRLPGCMGIA